MARNTVASVLAVTLLATVCFCVYGQERPGGDPSPLQVLLDKRVETLTKAVEHLAVQEKTASVGYEVVYNANAELFEAKLEAAATPERRVKVLEDYLEAAEALAILKEGRASLGGASTVDVLLARAAATHVEIRLLRARKSMESSGK